MPELWSLAALLAIATSGPLGPDSRGVCVADTEDRQQRPGDQGEGEAQARERFPRQDLQDLGQVDGTRQIWHICDLANVPEQGGLPDRAQNGRLRQRGRARSAE